MIAQLREGDPLELDTREPRTRWRTRGEVMSVMSQAGEQALGRLNVRCPGPIVTFVHEIFVHLLDKPRSSARPLRRTLVVLPAICSGEPLTVPGLTRGHATATTTEPSAEAKPMTRARL